MINAGVLALQERVKTKSGLEYQDVVPGQGPSPTVGIQVHFDTRCSARHIKCMGVISFWQLAGGQMKRQTEALPPLAYAQGSV